MVTNRAAALPSKQAYPVSVKDAPMPPPPKPDQVTVRVHATAINPVDMAMYTLGIIIQTYPYIPGNDCTGIVTAVGSSICSSPWEIGCAAA